MGVLFATQYSSSVRMGPERRSGPVKTTRLVVKLHQACVLASEGLSR